MSSSGVMDVRVRVPRLALLGGVGALLRLDRVPTLVAGLDDGAVALGDDAVFLEAKAISVEKHGRMRTKSLRTATGVALTPMMVATRTPTLKTTNLVVNCMVRMEVLAGWGTAGEPGYYSFIHRHFYTTPRVYIFSIISRIPT